MSIKKSFVELIDLLESNKDKKVSAILPQILELATSKKQSQTFKVDDKGNITEIFCWYHKDWEPVAWYGKKASSHTGFNTMCKQGVNQWTKQQVESKTARMNLLNDVAEGKVAIDEIQKHLEQIELDRNRIVARKEEVTE